MPTNTAGNVACELIFEGSPKIATEPASGWEDATAVNVSSAVQSITIIRDGEAWCSIRILDDGELILTGYRTGFLTHLCQNQTLAPTRPLNERTK